MLCFQDKIKITLQVCNVSNISKNQLWDWNI